MSRSVFYKGLEVFFDPEFPEDPHIRNGTMLEQAFNWIKAHSQKALRPNFKRRPGDPPHIVHVEMPDGTLEEQHVQPGYRLLGVNRLQQLADMAKNHFDSKVKASKRILISYNCDRVEMIFDHENGREGAALELNTSMEMKFFRERLNNQGIEPADFADMLRYDLRETYSDSFLLEQISKVSFSENNRASVDSARGRESMGSEVNRQVEQDPVGLPDEVQIFNVRYYTNPELDIRLPLTCRLDPDPTRRRWNLVVDHQSWTNLRAGIVDKVGGVLRDMLGDTEGVTIYEGVYRQEKADFT